MPPAQVGDHLRSQLPAPLPQAHLHQGGVCNGVRLNLAAPHRPNDSKRF
eukprot:CAMPEP_0175614412 /NCGR_PEP_ID=MMETSP0096-20121207/64839_1 /TAXON_ID=311494 /ORGANISM="Alexandrium monilatum, Strain CCMP3105" /LENGTH=48 /DNA_ID= /DNA_START= /DNA_END= /DNA_ORIENTATION=